MGSIKEYIYGEYEVNLTGTYLGDSDDLDIKYTKNNLWIIHMQERKIL